VNAPTTDCGLLVIGGGPAGVAAIRGYRDGGGAGPIVLVTAEDVLPYYRPALSKEFLRGRDDAVDLPIESPEFYHGVDVRLATAVTVLDVAGLSATLADGSAVRYRGCVLATGSDPSPLPVAGAQGPQVFLLRSLASAQRLRSAARDATAAVVVGSGFIGCEAAVSLARRGVRVTLVSQEPLPQRQRLGDAVGRRIAGWLAEEGIRLVLGAAVRRIEEGHRVYPEGHPPLAADVVLCGAGITPRVGVAESAGLRVDAGRVLVDAQMRTSAEGVYAAGDVALATNRAAGRRLAVEHWGDALRMGEIAGRNAAGGDDCWAQVPGFWTQIGDRTVKYAAWGDGYDDARRVEHGPHSFTVWYYRDGALVGALTCNADDDYERATRLMSAP
jgi:NADPH-dependent 2,4-dienoyl-CoA reductase/sulfur reductase-like enzyme